MKDYDALLLFYIIVAVISIAITALIFCLVIKADIPTWLKIAILWR